ncbi:RING-H2 finger protein ATL29 [Malania oleifera]|uniref:RING-H2 finger protein ATL29 n=1 Tax=Malania oleifera TaxID=397392 RepID=UPI0025AEA96E|nr:RING-H2 finger protein ATL29 [Malania oleifera]
MDIRSRAARRTSVTVKIGLEPSKSGSVSWSRIAKSLEPPRSRLCEVFLTMPRRHLASARCFMENLAHTWNLRRSPSGTPIGGQASIAPGLEPSIIQSFPTFVYSSIKDFHHEKYGLECAICLSEFEDDDMLRLLTVCFHVFHQECIDLWLESHKTCPVCRRTLDMPEQMSEKSLSINNNSMHEISENDHESSMDDTFSIDIRENIQESGSRSGKAQKMIVPNSARSQFERHSGKVERFPRSHSTGHSITRARGEEDRFTLRLPEHVKEKIARGRNWTGSCVAFGDFSSKTATANGGFGEASGWSSHGDINNV